MRLLLTLFSLSFFHLHADVRSTTGNIIFDVNSDDTEDMRVSTDGFGIGTSSPSSNLHVNGNAIVSEMTGVGTTAPVSTLSIHGSLGFSIETATANVTAGVNGCLLVDSSSDNIIVTLPHSGNVEGRRYTVKKIATDNEVRIKADNSYIGSENGITLSSGNLGSAIMYASSGNTWYISSYRHTSSVSSDNLVGYWKLDESGGTLPDSSTANNNGTNSGTTVTNGIIGNGRNFNGSSHSINCGNGSTLNGNVFTVTAWVKLAANNDIILNKYSTTPRRGFRILTNTSGFLIFAVGLSTDVYHATTGTLDINDANWHHIACTFGSDLTPRMYINGALHKTGTTAAATMGSHTDVVYSLSNISSQRFTGDMDEARFYSRVLSDAEILQLYQSYGY